MFITIGPVVLIILLLCVNIIFRTVSASEGDKNDVVDGEN